jgi:hypothetical protein
MSNILDTYLKFEADSVTKDGDTTYLVYSTMDGDATYEVEVVETTEGLIIRNKTIHHEFTLPGARLSYGNNCYGVEDSRYSTCLSYYLQLGPEGMAEADRHTARVLGQDTLEDDY